MKKVAGLEGMGEARAEHEGKQATNKKDREGAADASRNEKEAAAEEKKKQIIEVFWKDAFAESKNKKGLLTLEGYIASKGDGSDKRNKLKKLLADNQSVLNALRDPKTLEAEIRKSAREEEASRKLNMFGLTGKQLEAQKLEEANVPDCTLIEAVEQSHAFTQDLATKIEKINGHGDSPEEIKSAVKTYYSLEMFLGADYVAWSEKIGANTYFIQGKAKAQSGNKDDLEKKTATAEDLANVSKLMAGRGEISELIECIDAEKIGKYIGGAESVRTQMAGMAPFLTTQFLPQAFHRKIKHETERIAYNVWAHVLGEIAENKSAERKAQEVGTGEKLSAMASSGLGWVIGHLGSVGDAANAVAGNGELLGIGQSAESQADTTGAEIKFTQGSSGSDILNRVGEGFTALGGIYVLTQQAAEVKDAYKNKQYLELSIQVVQATQSFYNILENLNNIGGPALQLPIVGTVFKIVNGVLNALLYYRRWTDVCLLEEEEKANDNKSGLLAALKRTRKRTKTLLIYSALDIVSGVCQGLGEIFAAAQVVGAVFSTISGVISTGTMVFSVLEGIYEKGIAKEKELDVEEGRRKGALSDVLGGSDKFAVTAIVMEAKNALNKRPPNSSHVAVKTLDDLGITEELIKTESTAKLCERMLKVLQR